MFDKSLRVDSASVTANAFGSQSFAPGFASQFRQDGYAVLIVPSKDKPVVQ